MDDDWDHIDKIIEQVDEEGNSILIIACRNGMCEVVKKLLKMGCDYSYVNPNTRETALNCM